MPGLENKSLAMETEETHKVQSTDNQKTQEEKCQNENILIIKTEFRLIFDIECNLQLRFVYREFHKIFFQQNILPTKNHVKFW